MIKISLRKPKSRRYFIYLLAHFNLKKIWNHLRETRLHGVRPSFYHRLW